ncbi:YcxB family protein [Mucilaginibacter hurinus]|nr:YcxB family protein [Mucilaginibacter hurinus]
MLILASSYFLGFWQQGSFPVFQLVFAIFVLAGLPFSIYRSAKKQFNENEKLSETLTYTFDTRQVEIKGETFVSFLPWDKVKKVVELNNWILIYQDNRTLNVIPKIDLTTNDLNNLRNIIKSIGGLASNLKD